MTVPDGAQAAEILALERRALERWSAGDPSGFLELSAPDVVYFDPLVPSRIDGLAALTAYYAPVRGTFRLDRWELVNPHVQLAGDAAVLTYNFVSFSAAKGESRWQCTEVYRRDPVGWRIITTHWSPTAAR